MHRFLLCASLLVAAPSFADPAPLAWVKESPPLAEGKSRESFTFNAVGGSGARDVWVGGGVNNVGIDAGLDRWDGTAWTATPPASGDPIGGIFARSPTDAWAVGGQGTVQHWDGKAWSRVEVPSGRDLYGVWSAAAGDVWVVGDGGAILHAQSGKWKSVPSGTHKTLYRIWGASPRDVWAVGDGGTLLHFTGRAWSPVAAGTTENLLDVNGIGRDVWVVGQAGVVRHFDGKRWTPVDQPDHEKLISLAVRAREDVWMTGHEGLWHLQNGKWSKAPLELTPFGVWIAGDDLLAVGGDLVLRAKPAE